MNVLYLHKELYPYFSNDTSLFKQMMALQGEVFREQKGRITQRIKLGDKYYFIKQHHGIGWKEIFKDLFQGRLPVLGAKNEWRAIAALQSLGVAAAKVVLVFKFVNCSKDEN